MLPLVHTGAATHLECALASPVAWQSCAVVAPMVARSVVVDQAMAGDLAASGQDRPHWTPADWRWSWASAPGMQQCEVEALVVSWTVGLLVFFCQECASR
jgi:hypothetical protein